MTRKGVSLQVIKDILIIQLRLYTLKWETNIKEQHWNLYSVKKMKTINCYFK